MTNEMKKDLKVLIAVVVVMIITAFAVNRAYGEEYNYSNMYETEFGVNNAINHINELLDKANETQTNEDWLNYRRNWLRYEEEILKYYQSHTNNPEIINPIVEEIDTTKQWIKYYEDKIEYDKQMKLIEEVKEYNNKVFKEAYLKSKKAGKVIKPNYKEEPAHPVLPQMPNKL